MTALERIVERFFDYAGMFPPARLEFQEALKESARFPETLTRPHLLAADMVVKPERLNQLNDDTLRSAGFEEGRHVRVCLVGVPFGAAADALDRIRAFHAHARDTKMPREVAALEVSDENASDPVAEKTRALRQVALTATGNGIALYYEPRWEEDEWREGLDHVINLIRESGASGRVPVGLKVRCAGPTALGPATLAQVVTVVADKQIPLKVTQGLHHPLVEKDRYDFDIGFLSLAVAHHMRVGLGDAFTVQDAEACMTETDKDAFTFADGSVQWRDHTLAGKDLERALVPPLNIGSCSLQEPDADLERLYGAPAR